VRNLAQSAAVIGARLIHLSTDFVFDGMASAPYRPDAPCRPLSVYGHSKLAGERHLREVLPDRHLILRTSWVYAAQGHNFVRTMLSLMRQGKALRVVADQQGGPTWADPLALLIWTLSSLPVRGRTLHWSDAGQTTWFDFANAIQDEAQALGLLDRPVTITPVATPEYPTPARRPAYSVLDCAETEVWSGVPRTLWRENLRAMLRQTKDMEAWAYD
jgi:dTDP-4-dehydrorhamnose reductase